jgi:hypothetical protein
MSENNTFKVGDPVQWTQMTQQGQNMRLRALQGKIIGFCGNKAVCKQTKTGRIYDVALVRLRPISQVNELTELIMGKPAAETQDQEAQP